MVNRLFIWMNISKNELKAKAANEKLFTRSRVSEVSPLFSDAWI